MREARSDFPFHDGMSGLRPDGARLDYRTNLDTRIFGIAGLGDVIEVSRRAGAFESKSEGGRCTCDKCRIVASRVLISCPATFINASHAPRVGALHGRAVATGSSRGS